MTTERKLQLARRALTASVCAFFAMVCVWEAFGVPDCGHFCSTAQVATGGMNMWKWHVLGAVNGFVRSTPGPELFYAHHPLGVYFAAALGTKVFGLGSFGMRVTGIVTGAFAPPLVYLTAKRLSNPWAACLGTIAFVFTPIDLAFARFGSLEGFVLFGGLLFSWATVELFATWKLRHVVVAVVGATLAAHGDWIGAVFVCVVVGLCVVDAYAFPESRSRRTNDRRFAQWTLLSLFGALSILAYLLLFANQGHLSDLLGSYGGRAAGSDAPLLSAFGPRRKMWVAWSFPVYVLWAIPAGAVVSTLAFVARRRAHAVVVAWFVMASIQYFHFKQGADIHFFWPHYYGASVGLGVAVVAGAVGDGFVRLARAWSTRTRWIAVIATSFGVGVPSILLAREGLLQLWQSRITSGRFDEGGNHIDSMREHAAFVKFAYRDVPPTFDLALHSSIPDAPHLNWVAQRPTRGVDLSACGAEDPGRFALVDLRGVPKSQAEGMFKRFAVVVAGPFAKVDRASSAPTARVVRWNLRAPTFLERVFVQATEAVVDVKDEVDPYATWEVADMYDLPRPTLPETPDTLEQVRIAYDAASAVQDTVRVEALRGRFVRELGAGEGTLLAEGVTLLSAKVLRMGGDVAELYFETSENFHTFEGGLSIQGTVVAPPRLFWSGTDYFTRDVVAHSVIRPDLWKPKRIYRARFTILPRVGKEEFVGGITGGGGGSHAPVLLFTTHEG
ncbi:MAG: glycosyltransferase family 39 protein [Polyangiaceae bacterium]